MPSRDPGVFPMQETDSSGRYREIAAAVESWFRLNQRPLPWRDGYDPYHVWVSEVMLQQTRMEVVLPYFERFVARFPDLRTLANATDDEVVGAWSGLGYYRRARMLRDGARVVVREFGGIVPDHVDVLRSIPGIGRYTAGAIASVAYNRRAPIVDGNVARIVARLELIEEAVASPPLMRAAWEAEEALVDACRTPREFNQGLMEIGALICKPRNPACDRCPLTAYCRGFQRGVQPEVPRPRATGATRELVIPLYVIEDGEGRFLFRREEGALFRRMLHLPHGSSDLLPSAPPDVRPGALLGTFRHTITNRRIEFQVVRAELAGTSVREDDGHLWLTPAELAPLPHPSYVKKALKIATGK